MNSARAAPRTIRPCQEACPGRNSALQAGGCRGWSLGVYNPDLDPERHAARRIVAFLAGIIGSWAQAQAKATPQS
jgi:hypothetical protein